jgi:hypothetical protein
VTERGDKHPCRYGHRLLKAAAQRSTNLLPSVDPEVRGGILFIRPEEEGSVKGSKYI